MKRSVIGVSLIGVLLLSFVFLTVVKGRASDERDDERDPRIAQGFRISPVPLNLKGRDPELVGLGSYLVNAVGVCADCHSCPTYAPGHNPYGPPFGPPGGGDGKINNKNYLAGGVMFNPPGVVSANLTPEGDKRLPEGHTFREFRTLIRTGRDADEGGRILQVMPWPVYRNMSDHDLRAIYEFLHAIPPAEPGTCVAPGQ